MNLARSIGGYPVFSCPGPRTSCRSRSLIGRARLATTAVEWPLKLRRRLPRLGNALHL